ncbi:MAG: hypothetical protein KJN93_05205 [Alphaproteobacteria bacterium]|nr:hypothetical protein [Alphaproteobacteria bacterium]
MRRLAIAAAMGLALPAAAQAPDWRLSFGALNDTLVAEPADIYNAEAYENAAGPIVYVLLTDVFGAAFEIFTQNHIGEAISVRLCDRELMRPTLQAPIPTGQVVINAGSIEAADNLAALLRGETDCSALNP